MLLLELMVHMVHVPVWLIIAATNLPWLGSMGIEHVYLGGSVWAFGRPFFVGWCCRNIAYTNLYLFSRGQWCKGDWIWLIFGTLILGWTHTTEWVVGCCWFCFCKDSSPKVAFAWSAGSFFPHCRRRQWCSPNFMCPSLTRRPEWSGGIDVRGSELVSNQYTIWQTFT